MTATVRASLPFEAVFVDLSAGQPKTLARDFLDAGRFPLVDQGQELVGGYTDDESALCRAQLPVIVFGDHTRAVKYVDFPFGVGADGVKVLRPARDDDPRFLYWYLRAAMVQASGYDRHFKYLKRLQLSLPPVEEQRRIAAILDSADDLRAKRRESLALLESLTESIFLHMFGLRARAPVSLRSDEAGLPDGWTWEPLVDVAELATGHTPDRDVPTYWNGEIPWISLTEIRRLDGTVAAETELRVTQAGIDNSSSVVLPAGTVCFSRTASIGFVTVMGRPMATSQDFVNWICGERLRPTYLMHAFLRSREHLRAISTGSTHKEPSG